MRIPINVVGNIVNSDKVAHRVRVADDADDTGGFLIYEWWGGSEGPNERRGFDSWVENRDDLQQFFAESGWQIDWPA